MVSDTEEMIAVNCEIIVKADLAEKLMAAARQRDRTPASIMGEIIEAVLCDGLVDAILDDGVTTV
jgi:hypothetical protein